MSLNLQKFIPLKVTTLLIYCFFNSYAVTSASAQTSQQTNKSSSVTGIVRDDKNFPLSGATITVEKSTKATTTSVNGDYVLNLAPGTYTIIVSSVGFEGKRITEVLIKQNGQTDLNITLTPKKGTSLDNVIVTSSAKKETASSLLRTQKNSASMMDGISAETMRKTPDNNIAQSLARVSGVNVQGGKFVTIRGISDRYNNVQINGSSLPSSEPNRRNFSFDIIPSSLVDNVVVNKTASPDLPGEFTGGLVQVNTKDIPSKNFVELSIGTGINTESTNKDFIGFERDKNANTGKVNKDRLWFGTGRAFDPVKFYNQYNTNDTLATRATSQKIKNRWQFNTYAYTPVQNYQLSGGLAKRFKNSNSLGAIAAITYRNDQTYENAEARSPTNFDVINERYKYNTTIGSILNMAYKTKNHRIAWKNLYNKKYTNQVDDRIGFNESQQREKERRFGDVTLQGKLFQTRLEGDHVFGSKNYKVDWYADDIKYTREQPDTRYLLNKDLSKSLYDYEFKEPSLNNGGVYAAVFEEKRNNAGINFSVPFLIKGEKELVKIGYAFSNRKAEYENTGLRILAKDLNSNLIPNNRYAPYYTLVTPDKFDNGILYYDPVLSSNSKSGDSYTGTQKLHSFYSMLDFKFLKKFRFTGGVRYENNLVDVSTAKYILTNFGSPTSDTGAVYKENNWLPSTNIIYSLSNKINIRMAYSKTLSRPDFAERAFAEYFEFTDQLFIRGNVGLQLTTVDNYDLRFEYYPSGGEILSFSLFYKDFINAVERDFEVGNPSSTVSYLNRPRANAKGFEIDIRKNLAFIAKESKILKRILASCNFTYLKGQVTTGDSSITQQNRPIQGLAPYIINAGIGYEQRRWGLNLSFNRSGRKILNAGRDIQNTQLENPRSVLDLQLNAKFFKDKMQVRFNAGDILNQHYIIYSHSNKQGLLYDDPKGDAFNPESDFLNYKAKRGVNLSMSISYRF